MNGVDDSSVVGVGTEVLIVLKEHLAKRGRQASEILTLAQISRFDAVNVPMAGYSWVVLSKMCLICL